MILGVITMLVLSFFTPFVTVAFRGLIGIIAHWDDAANKRDQDISIMVLIQNIGDQIFSDERSETSDQLGLFWCMLIVLVFDLHISCGERYSFCMPRCERWQYTNRNYASCLRRSWIFGPVWTFWSLLQFLQWVLLEWCSNWSRSLYALQIINLSSIERWCRYRSWERKIRGVTTCMHCSQNGRWLSCLPLRTTSLCRSSYWDSWKMSISNRESRFKMIDADYSHTRDLTHTRPCGHELMMLLNQCILYCITVTGHDDLETSSRVSARRGQRQHKSCYRVIAVFEIETIPKCLESVTFHHL